MCSYCNERIAVTQVRGMRIFGFSRAFVGKENVSEKISLGSRSSPFGLNQWAPEGVRSLFLSVTIRGKIYTAAAIVARGNIQPCDTWSLLYSSGLSVAFSLGVSHGVYAELLGGVWCRIPGTCLCCVCLGTSC